MIKKVLVIGSEGFVGRHFIEYTSNQNSINREIYKVDFKNIEKPNYYNCDASRFKDIQKIIHKIKPDEIYNFAGSFSNEYPIAYLHNVIITKNIFDSLIFSKNKSCKILINGSAAEYGLIIDYDNPINENHSLNPGSYYGLTKIFQTFLAKTYFQKEDLKVYIARPVNILGYGVSEKLFIGQLIRQINLQLDKKSRIILGNLSNERDYFDIEDLIKAYLVIINEGSPGEIYNIGSESSIKIRDLLNLFLEIFEIDKSVVESSQDFIQKFDIPKIFSNCSKLKKLNWEPEISLEDSIKKIKSSIFHSI